MNSSANTGNSTRISILPDPDDSYLPNPEELARGAGILFVGRITGTVITILNQILLARLLGPNNFGLYAIGFALTRIVGAISPLGLESGIVRFGSTRWRPLQPEFHFLLRASQWLALAGGGIIGGIIFLLASPLANGVFRDPALEEVIRWTSINVMAFGVLQVTTAATQITRDMKYTVWAVEIIQPISMFILTIGLLLSGCGLSGVLAGTALSYGLAAIFAWTMVNVLFKDLNSLQKKSMIDLKDLVRFSLSISLGKLLFILISWVDRLVIAASRTPEEVGVYQAATQPSILFSVILGIFNPYMAASVAPLWENNQHETLNRLFQISTKWGLYISLPAFLLMWLAPRELITALFGDAYGRGVIVLQLLALGQLINVGTGAVGQLLMMSGRQKQWIKTAAFVLLFDLVLNFSLTPVLGIDGTAVAACLSTALLFLIGLFLVAREMRLWPYSLKYTKGLMAAILSGGAVYLFVQSGFSFASIPGVIFLLLADILLFSVVLIGLGLDSEEKELLQNMRKYFTSRMSFIFPAKLP
jgi:O-antigen/teichoic acid export membrane protein